jgi:hypothetical protein
MLAARLHHVLASAENQSEGNRVFWFTLGLVFSVIFSYLALKEAFAGEYIVQDDARQHVFWMQRFLDADLFPGDRIADYFQSVAPIGYRNLYQLLIAGDISPWWINKALPPVLSLISSAYCFGIAFQLLPVPMASFFASLLLTQSLWMKDDLISATPRAFVYPVFLAFLFYLLRRSLLGTAISAALVGLFYPQYSLIAIGILALQLLRWQPDPNTNDWKRYVPIRFSSDPMDYWVYGIALAVSAVILGQYAAGSDFGPVISAASVRDWPELQSGGRSAFFQDNGLEFWFTNPRSGLLHVGLVRPATLLCSVGLPFLLWWRDRFPLAQSVTQKAWILLQLLGVSVFWFLTAHAALFQLHLPSRYTEHSWRIVVAIAAGLVIAILADQVFQFFVANRPRQHYLIEFSLVVLMLAIGALIMVYPRFVPDFPTTKYKTGENPKLYEFLRDRPKDTMIASLSEEADNIPSFTQRSVLVAREYAIPYHWAYYGEFRDRANALITAQYSPDLDVLQAFITDYSINYWLIDSNAFRPGYVENAWFQQYGPPSAQALQNLRDSNDPALNQLRDQCRILTLDTAELMDANCITNKTADDLIPVEPEEADDSDEADDADDITEEN